jgi:hypothetical protein
MRFYEETEHVCDKFPIHYELSCFQISMICTLRSYSQTDNQKELYEISYDNGDREVNFKYSETLIYRSWMYRFPGSIVQFL